MSHRKICPERPSVGGYERGIGDHGSRAQELTAIGARHRLSDSASIYGRLFWRTLAPEFPNFQRQIRRSAVRPERKVMVM